MIDATVEKYALEKFPDIDYTKEMRTVALVVVDEIIRDIRRGVSYDGSPLAANATNGTVASRVSKLIKNPKTGSSKRALVKQPLIAEFRKLVQRDTYQIKPLGINEITITLTSAQHPNSETSVRQIAAWNNFGTPRIPARPFFGISPKASRYVMVNMRKAIFEKVKNEFKKFQARKKNA